MNGNQEKENNETETVCGSAADSLLNANGLAQAGFNTWSNPTRSSRKRLLRNSRKSKNTRTSQRQTEEAKIDQEKISRKAYATAKCQNTRAHKFDAPGLLEASEVQRLFLESQGICAYCGENAGILGMTIDHVIPLALNGSNTIENCKASCCHCNTFKKNNTLDELAAGVPASIVADLLNHPASTIHYRVKRGAIPSFTGAAGDSCLIPKWFIERFLPADYNPFRYLREVRKRKQELCLVG